MSFMRGDLLHKVAKLVKGGAMDRPRWFEAVMKVPPQPKELRCQRPPDIKYPEDPLIESYYARHPEAKLIPFSLQSFDAPVAKLFALRQLDYMKQGMSKWDARDRVEAEFTEQEELLEEETARLRRLALREGQATGREKSMLEQVQEEEMKFLAQGLESRARKRRGD